MFSIIIPAYNPGNYFQAAIDSVLAQTLSDWELIVVDDGSRPDQAEAIRAVVEAARHSERAQGNTIHLICQGNAGLSIARNVGIERASRPWIAFLDSDDIWNPTMLQTQLDAIHANPHAVLCFTGFDLIDGRGELIGPGWGGAMSYISMLSGRFTTLPSACAVQKSVLESMGVFDSLLLAAQDIDLFLRIMQRHACAYSPSHQVLYRQHESNMSRRFLVTWRECAHILRKHALWGEAKGRADVTRAVRLGLKKIQLTFGGQAFDAAREAFRERRVLDTLFYIGVAMRMAPRSTLSQMGRFIRRS